MDLADRTAGSCSGAGRGTEFGFMSATPADEPAPDELPPEDGPMPAVAVCAAAPEGAPVSEAAIASAQAQARVVIRISSGIPAVDYGSSDPGARYKGSGEIFKPS